mmetsp:Transcript_5309/g.9734  ORF Transcript_5309/g.9734 Transcript_5309/m.9734 type:complete len:256 (-) Transcript_5309:39-806(-)
MEGSKKFVGYLVNKTTNLLKFNEDTPDSPGDELANVYAEKCWVCGVGFSMLKGVLRYHCGFCANSVCSEHSMKKRQKPGSPEMLRICDTCESDFVREQLESTMQEEMKGLQSNLDALRYENELLIQTDVRLGQTLSKMQKDFTALTETQNNTLNTLKNKLEVERVADAQQVSEIDRLYAVSDVARAEEVSCREKLETTTQKLGSLQEGLREMKVQVAGLRQTLDGLETRTGAIPVKDLRNVLCSECEEAVLAALK